MKQLKHDRRSRRTQQLLGDALVKLMTEKPYDAISVQDILDRADVGRSTFYAHYLDKDDLLMHRLEHVVHAMNAGTDATTALLPSLPFLRHVRDYTQDYRALLWGNTVTLAMKYFHAHLCAIAEQRLAVLAPTGALVPVPVLANFVVGTLLNLVRWWVDSNPTYTPEEIDTMYWRMVIPAIESILGIHLTHGDQTPM